MQKFRASYSVLSLWSSGRWEDAIRQYFKLEKYVSQAQVLGKKLHEEWQEETDKTLCLPAVFGAKKLLQPQTELKLIFTLHEWLELVGVIDCYDKPICYEYKSGVTGSQTYANSKQVGVYAMLLTFNGLPVEKAEIYHYNYTNKKADMSIVWITEKILQEAFDWVESEASEMANYLEENNLYAKFNAKRETNIQNQQENNQTGDSNELDAP